MATLPHYIFPPPSALDSESPASAFLKTRPQIQLHTNTTTNSSLGLAVPTPPQYPRPEPLTTTISPPDSPTRIRASTMESDARILHDSSAATPPATPTRASHSKSTSASSIANSLSGLRRGDSTSSHTSRKRGTSIEESEKPGSTEPKIFPYWLSDYEIADKKKPLGSGLWSDVYLATPCLPKATEVFPTPAGSASAVMTPPITPIKSSKRQLPQLPPAYAIKVPASRSAKQVLGEEARVLSYLSRFPEAKECVVPFYGRDTRNDSLVLKAMDTTLEAWIQKELNQLPEDTRAKKLAHVFPSLATELLKGLEWMKEKECIHADIKPSNILLSLPTGSSTLQPIYSDFSSATVSALPPTAASKPAAPLGGGTWDFLDPTLLSRSAASTSPSPSPSPQSDIWSLAITLLVLVVGSSPFDCAGSNVFRRREMIKHGAPLPYVGYGDDGPRNLARLDALSRTLGFDVVKWFAKVLKRDGAQRVGLEEWREGLEKGLNG